MGVGGNIWIGPALLAKTGHPQETKTLSNIVASNCLFINTSIVKPTQAATRHEFSIALALTSTVKARIGLFA